MKTLRIHCNEPGCKNWFDQEYRDRDIHWDAVQLAKTYLCDFHKANRLLPYLTWEAKDFSAIVGVRWHVPEMDYLTLGYYIDAEGNVIGQDEHLIAWLYKHYPKKFQTFLAYVD